MKRIYKTEFFASHFIKGHETCGKRHNHHYRLKVIIDSTLPFLDFHIIKEKIEDALKEVGIIDHQENWLKNMTAENLAKLIHDNVKEKLKAFSISSVEVELFETEKYGVIYP